MEAVQLSSNDWFLFQIGLPIQDLDAAPYGGARFRVKALLDARLFVTFHLDVGLGDALCGQPELGVGRDWLAFAEIPSPTIAMISREQQFAEKIHAYTLPRNDRENTRVKDLIDLVLLLNLGLPDTDQVLQALRMTFERRRTHDLPQRLPDPPASWVERFVQEAEACGLGTLTCQEACERVALFGLNLPW